MENMDLESVEMDQMRDQVALLKSKLAKEPIVTDELLRKTMKRKAQIINGHAWMSVAASAFVIVWAFTLPKDGFSLAFVVATILMMLVCDFFTWKYHKDVNKKTMNGDLVTVAKVMKELKQNYKHWLKYGATMVVVWFVWLSVEYSIILNEWKLALPVIAALLVGLAIGGFIGLRMHKSVVNNAEDIIKQIEE